MCARRKFRAPQTHAIHEAYEKPFSAPELTYECGQVFL